MKRLDVRPRFTQIVSIFIAPFLEGRAHKHWHFQQEGPFPASPVLKLVSAATSGTAETLELNLWKNEMNESLEEGERPFVTGAQPAGVRPFGLTTVVICLRGSG